MQCRETKWHREQFPDGVDVIDAMIETALEENEYQRKEDRARKAAGDRDYVHISPKITKAQAKEWAIEVALHLGAMNPSLPGWHSTDPYWIMNSAYKQAVERGGERNPGQFGYLIAMEAMGHGRAWTDNNPDPDFEVPQHQPNW